MTAAVIDTNVLVKANNRSDGAPSPACLIASIEFLEQARAGIIVIDDCFRILKEYQAYANSTGQPGPGDAFLSWLFRNLYTPERCEQVTLTHDDLKVFAEFPDDPDLQSLDRSDRKFVAVALTSQYEPEIAVSGDRGWNRHEDALRRNGVSIRFLCP